MSMLSALTRIEKHFKMPFKQVITDLHLSKQYSINKLSKLCRVCRFSITKLAEDFGLKTRNIKEATKLTKNKGSKHWAFGLTKNTSHLYKRHSIRMKNNNPVFNNDNLVKAAISLSTTFKNNPLPQETKFMQYLDLHKVKYIFQYPLNRYVMDFFIPSKNLFIEIDSTGKWGKSRRLKASKKDLFISKLGFSVLRINKNLLSNNLYIRNILKTNNVIA